MGPYSVCHAQVGPQRTQVKSCNGKPVTRATVVTAAFASNGLLGATQSACLSFSPCRRYRLLEAISSHLFDFRANKVTRQCIEIKTLIERNQ